MKLAVVGAHLSGQPLNNQLTERNARLIRTTKTAPVYRLYALNTTPPKPGLVRVTAPLQHGIEVEVWEIGQVEFATFMDLIPSPLGIGTLELEDGEKVKGFIVEPYAIAEAKDISYRGSWRNYLNSSKLAPPQTPQTPQKPN